MKKTLRAPTFLVSLIAVLASLSALNATAETSAESEDWVAVFNGRNLDGWTAKIRTFEPGVNHADTFRVEDGLLTVSYDGYENYENRFGHLFYDTPYSHYRLRFEYRFIGDQAPDGPDWAWRNSGAMLHSQAPETMPAGQDFPVSIEFQLLGGRGDGSERPTGNLCTPGTNVHIDGKFEDTHCINADAPTLDGDQWVRAEALVLGSDRVVHYVNGEAVIEYTDVTTGGGAVSHHRPEMMPDGEPLDHGYISLQSESAPIQFRNVEVLNLVGCMDPDAVNYKPYYVKADEDACVY